MHAFLIFSLNNPYIPKECSTPLACGLNDQNVVAIYKLQHASMKNGRLQSPQIRTCDI